MKKVLALVLVAVIVVLSTVTVGATAIMYGDANGDKAINNRDVARLQQYLNGWDVQLGPDTTTTTTVAVRPPAEIPDNDVLSLQAATALGLSMEEDSYTEDKYYVSGTIAVVHNNYHGVVEIEDTQGNRLTVYGIDISTADGRYGFHYLLPQPKVGDAVTVQGVIGRHNGVAQMNYAYIVEHNGNAPDYFHPSTALDMTTAISTNTTTKATNTTGTVSSKTTTASTTKTTTERPTYPTGTTAIDEGGIYDSKEDVALYLYTYGKLPKNFVTKSQYNSLGKPANMCCGGDRFYNKEGLLPNKEGRLYYECDIDTYGITDRGAKRLVYSNDGLIYYTDDHYSSFTLLYGTP